MTSVMNGPYTTHWPVQHTDESTVWTEICSAKIDLVLVFHFMSLLTSTSSLVTNLQKKTRATFLQYLPCDLLPSEGRP